MSDEWDEKADNLQEVLGIIRGEDSDCDASDHKIIVEALREASHTQDAEVERLRGELAKKTDELLCATQDSGWLARKLAKARDESREEAIAVIKGGHFLHDESMEAKYAEAIVDAIRRAAQARARSK